MRLSPAKLLFLGFLLMFGVMMVGTTPATDAQTFPGDYMNKGPLYVYCAFDGQNVKDSGQSNPIEINLEGPMTLDLQINVTGLQSLNMSGKIVFYYQGIAVLPIQIVEPVTNSTWIWVDPSVPIDPISVPLSLYQAFTYQGVKVVTGILQASVDFQFFLEGNTTLNQLKQNFYFDIPFTPQDVFTSVTGIGATVATIGAAYGVGSGIMALIDGLKTAYKLRGIHKKASELRSLPNLTVIGALPLLFSVLAGMGKIKRKKKEEEEEGRDDSGVSEYIVRQKLREVAPDAWPGDKCPQCLKKWNTKKDMCTKCKIGPDEARLAYAEHLTDKVPRALSSMGKKKSMDIRGLAKKTKSTDYNAGVIATAMVDTGVTEIVKVGTPLRSFVMNIAGLAFLVVTWQQLLGDSASTYQTTITIVGAALSLAVIVALYVSRRSQIQKFRTEAEDEEVPAPPTGPDEGEARDEPADEVAESPSPTEDEEVDLAVEETAGEEDGEVETHIEEEEPFLEEPQEESTTTDEAAESSENLPTEDEGEE